MPEYEWTAEKDAQLRQLFRGDLTTIAMGLHFNVHRRTVEKRIKFLQLARPRLRPSFGGQPSTWPEEKDAQLTKLWADKALSTIAIGRQMGISKNAVVGRAHRLRLPSRPSPIRWGGSGSHPTARRRPPVIKLATLESLRTPMLVQPTAAVRAPEPMPVQSGPSLPCCFPQGEPRTPSFRYCDEPSRVGSSYCDFHHRLCHVRVRAWEDAA